MKSVVLRIFLVVVVGFEFVVLLGVVLCVFLLFLLFVCVCVMFLCDVKVFVGLGIGFIV